MLFIKGSDEIQNLAQRVRCQMSDMKSIPDIIGALVLPQRPPEAIELVTKFYDENVCLWSLS
jgi:hypothetical protein